MRYWIFAVSLLVTSVATAQSVGVGFTYQGELRTIEPSGDTVPADGNFDFSFSLFDRDIDGSTIGEPFVINDVLVQDGVFVVDMDFGVEPYAFDGDQLWLQIGVRDAGASGDYAALSPRQAITTTPFTNFTVLLTEDAVTAAEVVADEVQLRVDESCPEGTLVESIGADGSITCVADNDAQTLTLDGSELSLSDGNQSVTLTGTNNDTNELKTGFVLSGDVLSLSDASGSRVADLSSLLDNTDAQTLSLSDTSVVISGGNAVDLAALFNDNDPTNELNTSVSFDGTNLNLTDAGDILSVDLSGLSDSAVELLSKLTTVDGADSGLDADLLDGLQASELITVAGLKDNRIPITEVPFRIEEPGSYIVTQDLINTTDDTNGIQIDADNVTLDLGGFRLTSDMGPSVGPGTTARVGIQIFSQNNVVIRNGHITDWDASGIGASGCDSCVYENLTISRTSVGLRAGDYSIIHHVTSSFNRVLGISLSEGSLIAHSTAHDNEGGGIAGSGSSVIFNCSSFRNENIGYNVGASTIIASAAFENGLSGFRLGTGGTVQQSVSYDNGENGFFIISGHARDNVAARNGNLGTTNSTNNGFFANGNSYLINNYSHENNGAGIRSQFGDNTIENNTVIDNDRSGIEGNPGEGGGLIIGNRASGNGPNSSTVVNYDFAGTTNAVGPIVNINGAGDISAVVGADHPLVNYEY